MIPNEIIGALIALFGAVIGGLMSGSFMIYIQRQDTKAELNEKIYLPLIRELEKLKVNVENFEKYFIALAKLNNVLNGGYVKSKNNNKTMIDIYLLIALLIGILAGVFTGLFPGIHINLIALLLISLHHCFISVAIVFYDNKLP